MFCPNCGTKLEEGLNFCPECGRRILTEEVASSAEETGGFTEPPAGDSKNLFSRRNVKGMIGIVAAVAVVILIVKFMAAVFVAEKPDSVAAVYDSENNESVIYVNGKNAGTVDGEAELYSDMDGEADFIYADGTVYYIKGKKLIEVMDDCRSIIVAAHAGAALLMDEDNALQRYTCSDRKLTELTDENVYTCAISGDGKYFAYTTYDDDGDKVSYIGRKAGSETKVKGVVVYVISEDGKYMYGLEYDEDDYSENLVLINRKGETEIIAKDIDEIVGFNEDGTEIMFLQDGKTYVSVKGKDKQKVSSHEITTVLCGKSSPDNMDGFFPVKSFQGAVVQISDDGEFEISILSSRYEAETIVKDVTYVTYMDITEDASKIFYQEGDELYYVKAKKNAKAKKLADDVGRVVGISRDGKHIYYNNEDDELCYIKGTGKSSAVKDPEECYYGYMCDDSLYVYSSEDEEYYYVKGKKARKLDNISMVRYDVSADVVYGADEDTFYEIDGSRIKKLKGDFDEISDVIFR